MHTLRYAEIMEDDQQEARQRERFALDRSITLLELAAVEGASAADVAAAIVFTSKLWTILIEDLANPGNGLPKPLRGQIISIGIWILRELDGLRNAPEAKFDDIISVSKAIRDGLL